MTVLKIKQAVLPILAVMSMMGVVVGVMILNTLHYIT